MRLNGYGLSYVMRKEETKQENLGTAKFSSVHQLLDGAMVDCCRNKAFIKYTKDFKQFKQLKTM